MNYDEDPRPRCENCRYGIETGMQYDPIVCHRHAPIVRLYPEYGSQQSVWPYVGTNAWCGDHEPKKVKQSEPTHD